MSFGIDAAPGTKEALVACVITGVKSWQDHDIVFRPVELAIGFVSECCTGQYHTRLEFELIQVE